MTFFVGDELGQLKSVTYAAQKEGPSIHVGDSLLVSADGPSKSAAIQALTASETSVNLA
jgi:hypothetical protein